MFLLFMIHQYSRWLNNSTITAHSSNRKTIGNSIIIVTIGKNDLYIKFVINIVEGLF